MYDASKDKQDSLKETPKAGRKPEVKRYEMVMWGGKIPVYKCLKCSFQTEDKDRIILHTVGHVPEREQEKLLDDLVEEGYDDK
jgi:hypothetical protein